MSPLRHTLPRMLALVSTFACGIALVLLLDLRPPLPPLPGTFSIPITLPLLRAILELAAWTLSLLLAVVLLARSLGALLRRRPRPLRIDPTPPPRQRPLARARLAAGAAQGGFPPPFPLILHAPAEGDRRIEVAPVQAPPAAAGTATSRAAVARTVPRQLSLLPPSIAVLGALEIAPSKPRRRRLRAQTQQLLAHLALHPEGATTDELVAALWPDIDDDNARQRLWRSTSEARGQLGEAIIRTGEHYRLDRQTVTVDLDRFETLLAAADADGAQRQSLLEQALALVRGEPLAGSDYPWAVGDTHRLRATILDRLQELGHLRLDAGDSTGALAAAEQALALDLLNEGAHRLAMHAESSLGLRQAVATRYEKLRERLEDRFGLEPERETRRLHRQLLSQDPAQK